MATIGGHLQALINVPSGGWSVDFVDSVAGAFTVTIDEGQYYMDGTTPTAEVSGAGVDSLRNDFNDQLQAKASLIINMAEGRTNFVRFLGATFSATWNDTDLRDLLGFTADIPAGSSNVTGANQTQAIWIPGCPVQTLHHEKIANFDEWRGNLESDFRSVEHISGMSRVFAGSSAYVRDLSWSHVARKRTWIADEAVPNESWERFYEGAICGRYIWAKPGGPVRWHSVHEHSLIYPSASDAPSQYKIPPGSVPRPEPAVSGYNGLWKVSIPRAVLIPELFDV